MAASLTRCASGYCCGCAGVVAGGGVAVGAVGVERGSKYQTRTRARTIAAVMMSNLFVSIWSAHGSLCRTTLAPVWALGQVKPSGRRNITWPCGPRSKPNTSRHRHGTANCGA